MEEEEDSTTYSNPRTVDGRTNGWTDGRYDADAVADGWYDADADAGYLYGRVGANGWWSPGGDWRIGLRGAGQIADSSLLPSEQFAAGGFQTVRGVSEREFFADVSASVVNNRQPVRIGVLSKADISSVH